MFLLFFIEHLRIFLIVAAIWVSISLVLVGLLCLAKEIGRLVERRRIYLVWGREAKWNKSVQENWSTILPATSSVPPAMPQKGNAA